MSKRIAIVGSREYKDLDNVKLVINDMAPFKPVIISGGARGVDREATKQAQIIGLKTSIYWADWEIHGKAAGFIRNQLIVDNSDACIAFWDGKSKGTLDTVRKMEKAKKPVLIIKDIDDYRVEMGNFLQKIFLE